MRHILNLFFGGFFLSWVAAAQVVVVLLTGPLDASETALVSSAADEGGAAWSGGVATYEEAIGSDGVADEESCWASSFSSLVSSRLRFLLSASTILAWWPGGSCELPSEIVTSGVEVESGGLPVFLTTILVWRRGGSCGLLSVLVTSGDAGGAGGLSFFFGVDFTRRRKGRDGPLFFLGTIVRVRRGRDICGGEADGLLSLSTILVRRGGGGELLASRLICGEDGGVVDEIDGLSSMGTIPVVRRRGRGGLPSLSSNFGDSG